MAKIKTLYDSENNAIAPRTHVNAVTNDNGDSLASLLEAADEKISKNTKLATDNSVKIQDLHDYLVMFYAAGRTNGDADPDLTLAYGNKDALSVILSHLKIGTFKNGKKVYECKGGRITADKTGLPVAIDGTDGDVLIYADCDLYFARQTTVIDGVEKNLMGIGLAPFSLAGVEAKKFEPFAFTPHYTVNAQLDGDYRSCAHSVYNPDVAGQYNTPVALFKQTYKASGKGYPSQYITSLGSSQQARNKNEDSATNTPYMGLYYEFYEIWLAAIYLELGTLDFTQTNLMGYGCTATGATASNFADEAISGISGIRLAQSDGTVSYLALNNNQFKTTSGGTATYALDGLVGQSRHGFTEILECHRVLDTIHASGLVSMIGSSSNIFTDGGATCITDGSVDLLTGEGMEAGKKYYTVRDVPNCQGMADGVMTAVVNIYFKMEVADGVYYGTTDITGATAIFKFSHPIYRGLELSSGMCTNLEGMYYTIYNEGGSYYNRFYSADKYSDVPVIAGGNTIYGAVGTEFQPLKGLKLRFEQATANGWVKTADYNDSLYRFKTVGGGQHTYECAYIWRSNCWGQGTNGLPADGYECVDASCAGCAAVNGSAGRFLVAAYAAAATADFFAGGFALPSIEN